MSRFVLVHGAWLGAWCWDQVAAHLRASGHEVVAPELPGHGRDQTPDSAISLEAYVDSAARAVSDGAVVVGHSMAGIVISSLADRMPQAISTLIYVAAYLLQGGESIVEVSGTDSESLVGTAMIPAADWSTIAIKPEAVPDVFAADAPAASLERLKTLARPEPAGPFNTPVQVTAANFGRVPRSYIRTAHDGAVTPRLQDAMLAKTPCSQVVTMNTSHTPFFAAPPELAQHLIQLAARGKEAGV